MSGRDIPTITELNEMIRTREANATREKLIGELRLALTKAGSDAERWHAEQQIGAFGTLATIALAFPETWDLAEKFNQKADGR